jgi:hypothetical protein
MQPQGTAPVNSSYIGNLTDRINGIQGTGACAELQDCVNKAAASINAQLAGIRAEIAHLESLIVMPTSLGGVIAWITNFSAPLVTAYNTYTTQLATLLSEIAALETAIGNAASRLTSCSITIPPMT